MNECSHLFMGPIGFEEAPCAKCGVLWTEVEYLRSVFERQHARNPGARHGDGYYNADDDIAWSIWKSAIDAAHESVAGKETQS